MAAWKDIGVHIAQVIFENTLIRGDKAAFNLTELICYIQIKIYKYNYAFFFLHQTKKLTLICITPLHLLQYFLISHLLLLWITSIYDSVAEQFWEVMVVCKAHNLVRPPLIPISPHIKN